jgi:hypothetical protein
VALVSDAKPFDDEEIEAARKHPMAGEVRWLATVDALRADLSEIQTAARRILDLNEGANYHLHAEWETEPYTRPDGTEGRQFTVKGERDRDAHREFYSGGCIGCLTDLRRLVEERV